MFVREGPVTVKKVTKPEINKDTGKYNTPVEKTVTVQGALHPVLGEDLDKLPSGFRVTDAKTLFLHEPLAEGDIIMYKGTELHIHHKDEWDPEYSPIPHYRYLMLKDVAR